MGVHDKYYGEAMREVERGVRRDDIWGRAYAGSGGDVQKAKALYVDLLAERLEMDAGAPEKAAAAVAVAQRGKNILWRIFRWTTYLIGSASLALAVTYGVSQAYYESHYQKALARIWDAQQSGLKTLQASLAKDGIQIPDTKLNDLMSESYGQWDNAYGFNAAQSIMNFALKMSASRRYAIDESRMSDDLKSLICTGTFFGALALCITWLRRPSKNRRGESV